MTTPTEPTNEEPRPKLVRTYGYDAPELPGVTDSAQPRHWPQGPKPVVRSHPASHADQLAAWADYQKRPDIESRNSILRREHAQPGEFLPAHLAGGVIPEERPTKFDMTEADVVGPYKALPNDAANLNTDDPTEVYLQEDLTPYFGEVETPENDGEGSTPSDGPQGPFTGDAAPTPEAPVAGDSEEEVAP